jgi:hypothetical protein
MGGASTASSSATDKPLRPPVGGDAMVRLYQQIYVNSKNIYMRVCVCVCVRVHVRVHVLVHVLVLVRVRVRRAPCACALVRLREG